MMIGIRSQSSAARSLSPRWAELSPMECGLYIDFHLVRQEGIWRTAALRCPDSRGRLSSTSTSRCLSAAFDLVVAPDPRRHPVSPLTQSEHAGARTVP